MHGTTIQCTGHDPVTWQHTSTRLHTIPSHKADIITVCATRTSNLATYSRFTRLSRFSSTVIWLSYSSSSLSVTRVSRFSIFLIRFQRQYSRSTLVSGSKFSNRPIFWWFMSNSCFTRRHTAELLQFYLLLSLSNILTLSGPTFHMLEQPFLFLWCLISPYGPYGLYRASVPVERCTLPYLYLYLFFSELSCTICTLILNCRRITIIYTGGPGDGNGFPPPRRIP